MSYYTKKILNNTIPSIIYKSSLKFNYSNKVLLDIPLSIEKFNYNNIIFDTKHNINFNDTKILWNVCNINQIKIIININNFDLIDNYIYNYKLINFNNNTYHLIYNNKIMITPFSKMLNSCWFLSNLYK
jgi:hypothetical protein